MHDDLIVLMFVVMIYSAIVYYVQEYKRNKYSGIILPPKPKKPSSHTCKMPFFDKPEGTLYRCPTCLQVWCSYLVHNTRHGAVFHWKTASLDDWTNAGGSSK
jgi:hypothetical protein